MLRTPDARKLLGIEIKNNKLVITGDEDQTVAHLARLVSDVANHVVKVTDLDNKDQRISYSQKIVSEPLMQSTVTSGNRATSGGQSTSGAKTTKAVRTNSPDRKNLIPKQCKLNIQHQRINEIYHELLKLNVHEFTNSCAVMLRVFIELSIDEYANRKKIQVVIPPKPNVPRPTFQDLSLRQKINEAIKYMDTNNLLDKAGLHGIRALASQSGHVLSVDSLNAYVHNSQYNPSAADLKKNWDSIQTFVESLWA